MELNSLPRAAPVSTTFIVANLHCASCVTHVEEALGALSPPPIAISHSIIQHSVTVVHPVSLSVVTIARTLEDAGFELFYEHASRTAPLLDSIDQAIHRWGFPSPTLESNKRKRHLETCQLCRSKDGTQVYQPRSSSSEQRRPLTSLSLEKQTVPSLPDDKLSPCVSVTAAPVDAAPGLYEATLAITDMTCSACTGPITRALEDKDFVESVNVNLMTHSATVLFRDISNKDELAKAVGDVGFDASIQDVHAAHPPLASQVQDSWRATLAIDNMTCASCVNTVSKALEEPAWTESVSVNLLTASATVTFCGKSNSAALVGLVEDRGFEATLQTLEPLDGPQILKSQRQVAVRVDGMCCSQCPSRVLEALADVEKLTIIRDPTLQDPIVEFEYTPAPPELTLRAIFDKLVRTNQSFVPSLYHKPTIEERSRSVQLRERRHILLRLILAVVVAIPTFIIGIVYMDLVSSSNPAKAFLMQSLRGVRRADWALFALATPVYFFAADLFHRRTFKELRALWRPGSPTPLAKRFLRFGSMNMLVCFGTSIAYWSSIAELGILAAHPDASSNLLSSNPFYFDSVVFLTMFLLLGRLIEAISKAKTGDAVAALGNLRPDSALLVVDSDVGKDAVSTTTERISADLLELGDTVKVVYGSSPPRDGIIIQGSTNVDESSLTGESKPVFKTMGDTVFAGTVIKGQPITVRITGQPGTSMLDKIMAVVREGQAKRAPMERLADHLTAYFVPFVTAVAIATWAIWLALGFSGALPQDWMDLRVGGWAFWSLQFAIAVFVIACPCGLGLAAPTALFVGGGLAAQRGILVKGGGEAFQEASRLDIVAFDKTGTLTLGGEPKISDSSLYLPPNDTFNESSLHAIVHKLEGDSDHPVARALVSHCSSLTSRDDIALQSSEEIPGKGMRGTVRIPDNDDGHKTIEVIAGNESLMHDFAVPISPAQHAALAHWKEQGCSVALVAAKLAPPAWHLCATFAAADRLRPEAPAVVRALHARGIAVWLVSGDNATTAAAVAAQAGIPASRVIAGVLPAEKAARVTYLQRSQPPRATLSSRLLALLPSWLRTTTAPAQRRALVAFVGDGINDAPALAAADVSIAVGSGTDVALAAASFVLLARGLRGLPALLDLSAAVFARVRANFAWALVYNIVALPVAAGALYAVRSEGGAHVRLDPAWAALAMAASSVSVVLSSLALRTRLPVLGFRERRWEDEQGDE